jgi:hypothetical protein
MAKQTGKRKPSLHASFLFNLYRLSLSKLVKRFVHVFDVNQTLCASGNECKPSISRGRGFAKRLGMYAEKLGMGIEPHASKEISTVSLANCAAC